MKYICEIEYPDECGPVWMNKWNLESCLFSKTHISNVEVKVSDHLCEPVKTILKKLKKKEN